VFDGTSLSLFAPAYSDLFSEIPFSGMAPHQSGSPVAARLSARIIYQTGWRTVFFYIELTRDGNSAASSAPRATIDTSRDHALSRVVAPSRSRSLKNAARQRRSFAATLMRHRGNSERHRS
jgi:hypothetical protein